MILKIHASKVKMSESIDLSSYAKNLPGIVCLVFYWRLLF